MRLLSHMQIADMLGVSRSTLYELRKHPDFPRPFDVGGNKWRDSSIERWIKAQEAKPEKSRIPT